MVLPQQRKRREMFPNTALNSISPDVRMMQAFPNIFLLKEIVGHPTGCATRCKQANNRETSCERMFCHLLMRDLSFRFMLVAATPRCASRGIIRSKNVGNALLCTTKMDIRAAFCAASQ